MSEENKETRAATPVAPSPDQLRIVDLERQLAEAKTKTQHGALVTTIQSKESEITTLKQKVAILEKNQQAVASTPLGDNAMLDVKATADSMPVCDCRVHLDKHHDLPKTGVTPAEAVVLIAQFHAQKGDMPIHAITPHVEQVPKLDGSRKVVRDGETFQAVIESKEVKLVKRQPDQEIARLKSRYGEKKVAALFPGANPTLPDSLRSALRIGMSVALPSSTLAKEQGGDRLASIVINA